LARNMPVRQFPGSTLHREPSKPSKTNRLTSS